MYDELLLLSLLINWLIFREDDARFRDTTLSFACNWGEIIFRKKVSTGLFVISIIISWTNKRERPSRFLFKFIVNIFMETIRDYLELQSLFHLYIYIYMYIDSIETFTTFTVNRVRINHQEIESLLRSLRFSNRRRRNLTIFPDSNKLQNYSKLFAKIEK